MKAVMNGQRLSVLFEAQTHSELPLADVEAIYLPHKYQAPPTDVLKSRCADVYELANRYGWAVMFCS